MDLNYSKGMLLELEHKTDRVLYSKHRLDPREKADRVLDPKSRNCKVHKVHVGCFRTLLDRHFETCLFQFDFLIEPYIMCIAF